LTIVLDINNYSTDYHHFINHTLLDFAMVAKWITSVPPVSGSQMEFKSPAGQLKIKS